ncbi:piwi-like protein Ago3 [Leptopilina heterotoma]|uniref:piwi-like protein Ago3 n=1 Tax=Leptopilina heterotoma TaxID=63436 RepID=UPI001CA8E38D|nr:piwi-like protein Ago3 [Leptopilina heterotoma]
MEGTGRGRASLLDRLKQQQAQVRQAEETIDEPKESQDVSPVVTIGRGRGIASLLASVEAAKPQEAPPPPSLGGGRGRASFILPPESTAASSTVASIFGRGRGSAPSLVSVKSTTTTTTSSGSTPTTSTTSRDVSGVVAPLEALNITETKSSEPDIVSRQGESGRPIHLTSNYINLSIEPGKELNMYEVKYNPDIDSRPLRNRLLLQHTNVIGTTKNFDGSLLYLPRKLEKEVTVLDSTHPADESKVRLQIIFKKTQKMHENVTFFNILINRVMKALQLVKVGRKTFNPACGHVVQQHRLEIWPGYVTAINEYEGGLKLCIDSSHRVMRTDTVRDFMRDISKKDPKNFKDKVVNELLGTSVLTRYNNQTYRIDDIAWDKSPKFSFNRKGQDISLVDYYKTQWNLIIQDYDQPLLVNRSKERTSDGQTIERMLLLIPEFCYLTGITDAMRSDFRIMKDIQQVTGMNPSARRDVIRKFVAKVKETDVTRELLAGWGLRMEADTIKITGRALDPEMLIFGNNKTLSAGPKANWPGATKMPVLRTPHLETWCLLFDKRDEKKAKDFVQTLKFVGKAVDMTIREPQMIALPNDRTESFLVKLKEIIRPNIDIVVLIFPAQRQDRYAAVKKLCCVDMPVPSQVILSKTIGMDPKKTKSAVEKIALQINCKLGGALWALKIPFDKCMVCGVDVYHAGPGKVTHGSAAGFVASMDKGLTSWYSKICIQTRNQELVDLLKICLVSAVKAYHQKNGFYPDRIFLYRDGVGDGQLEVVTKYEVKQLLSAFSLISTDYSPKLTIIIVQKRINTRILAIQQRELENPPPGTIVDSDVTKRNYYDFYLISQHVGRGTVSPTHYIIIHDSANMKTDHLQRLTYKLCHLYYNWCGTVRVPAPCMYAHKLAYLVGQSLQIEPSEKLAHHLYYL